MGRWVDKVSVGTRQRIQQKGKQGRSGSACCQLQAMRCGGDTPTFVLTSSTRTQRTAQAVHCCCQLSHKHIIVPLLLSQPYLEVPVGPCCWPWPAAAVAAAAVLCSQWVARQGAGQRGSREQHQQHQAAAGLLHARRQLQACCCVRCEGRRWRVRGSLQD